MERRAKLTEDIKTNMVSKGELVQVNPLVSSVSDVDGYGQETPFLGLFGSLFGEIILFLRCAQ